MTKFWLTLCLILFSSSFVSAQLKYADRLFEENDFQEAANLYEKVLAKDSNQIEVIERLAFCYKKVNRYDDAEKFYAKAVQYPEANAESYFNYGQLLKNNNKIKQARDQFQKFIEKEPESLIGKLALHSCDAIGEWTSTASEFQLKNMDPINTEYLEFGPFPMGSKLLFTSNKNYLGGEEKGKVTPSPEDLSTSIYVYDSTDHEKPIQSFSSNINSIDNIEGPAFMNGSHSKIFFTKTYNRQRNVVNQMELHTSSFDVDHWNTSIPLSFIDRNYSFTNAVLSPDEKLLFFASDLAHGQGGMDIYVCEKIDNEYQKPKPLSQQINSSGNEVPSYFDEEGNLYFSSDFLPGFGGMDIFKSKLTGDSWSTPENIKTPFNSSKDDFGFIKIDSTSGYFASNRDGGKGLDDIYYYYKHRFTDSSYYTDISGKFVLDTLPLMNFTIALLDENDEIVQTLVTNKRGEFTFKNVKAGVRYKILIDEDPDKVPEEARVYLTDDRFNQIMLIERLQKGLFEFRALKRDEYLGLSLMDEVDDAGLPTLKVRGQLSSKNPQSVIDGKQVYIVDENGNILASTFTDRLGQFNFEKLSIDEQYLFRLEEEDVDIDIQIINTEGRVIGRTLKNKDGIYVYHKFTINPSGEPDIRGVFRYGNLPADGVSLYLLDENDMLVQLTRTNVKGEFEFTKLNPGTDYKIKVDSTIKIPGNANLFIMDEHTGLLLPVSKLANGLFKFETLAPIPPEELALMEEEDYVLKPRQSMIGKVSNELNPASVNDLLIQIVNKNGNVVAVSKTDGRGVFKFFNLPIDDNYLFKIPEDDPNFKINIINKQDKVIGEAKRNDQSQFVYHKFTINPSKKPDIRGMFKYGELPANDVSLNLIGENDEVLQMVKTNKNGEFAFKSLKAGKSYHIEIDESMGEMPSNTNMFIYDEYTGLMLPVSKLNNGLFKFETLAPMEVEGMALMDEVDDEEIDESGVLYSFFGQLFDNQPMAMHEGLKIHVVDKDGNTINTAVVDRFGKFKYEKLPLKDEYLMRISEDDPNYKLNVMSENGELLGALERNEKGDFVFNRKKIEEEKLVSANRLRKIREAHLSDKPYVYFDFGKWTLNDFSKDELVKATSILKNDPSQKIEISSHTDSRGPAEYNMWLAEQRSAAIKKYLTDNGIESKRIVVHNYGETKPINECVDGVECSMEKHAENRRTELKLIR